MFFCIRCSNLLTPDHGGFFCMRCERIRGSEERTYFARLELAHAAAGFVAAALDRVVRSVASRKVSE